MASKVVYTSTIRLPIYASWKCKKCDHVNFSSGNILFQGIAASYSFKNSKLEAAKQDARDQVEKTWLPNAYYMMTKTRSFPNDLREKLYLQKPKCNKCGKTPIWLDKGTRYTVISSISIFIALICLFSIFSGRTTLYTWIALAIAASGFLICFILDRRYELKWDNLPDDYLPVIGSMNEELLEYAQGKDIKIPTLEECVMMVRGTTETPEQESTPNNTVEVPTPEECVTMDKGKTETPEQESAPDITDIHQEEPRVEEKTDKDRSADESLNLIKQLAELHEQGILTDEEFQEKKEKLLSNI